MAKHLNEISHKFVIVWKEEAGVLPFSVIPTSARFNLITIKKINDHYQAYEQVLNDKGEAVSTEEIAGYGETLLQAIDSALKISGNISHIFSIEDWDKLNQRKFGIVKGELRARWYYPPDPRWQVKKYSPKEYKAIVKQQLAKGKHLTEEKAIKAYSAYAKERIEKFKAEEHLF